MAAGLGVKLGSIASVEESSSSSTPIPFYRNDVKTMEAESAPTTIQPGELEISARVTVVHHIK